MPPRHEVGGRLPRDEVTAILAMDLADRRAHLAFHAVQPATHALDLVLQLQHLLHAGQVQAELVRQLLDEAEPVQIGLGIQSRVARRSLRPDQPLALVDAKRLRVHADEISRHGDHVARTVVHHSPSFSRRSCSSLRRMITNVTRTPTVPTLTRTIAAVFTGTTPPAGPHATPS